MCFVIPHFHDIFIFAVFEQCLHVITKPIIMWFLLLNDSVAQMFSDQLLLRQMKCIPSDELHMRGQNK